MYRVTYKCSNCGWSGSLHFDCGTKAPDVSGCPNCQCCTASKLWEQTPSMPFKNKGYWRKSINLKIDEYVWTLDEKDVPACGY